MRKILIPYLKGEATLLLKSETARPTYLSPTSKPSNRPRSTAGVFSNFWYRLSGFMCFICQSIIYKLVLYMHASPPL